MHKRLCPLSEELSRTKGACNVAATLHVGFYQSPQSLRCGLLKILQKGKTECRLPISLLPQQNAFVRY